MKYITKSLWLLVLSVIICCGIYPGIVWVIGQTFFKFQANGSMLNGPDGNPVGSLLIAQPFTQDEYFQPRPSAAGAGYDASASSSSALSVSNYTLRNRVATQLGPIVKYKGGPKDGQLVAADIETWYQKDQFQGNPGILAQWADLHNGVAQAWVTGNATLTSYIQGDWSTAHPAVIAKFKSDNPTITSPQASDLAIVFFETYSKENPGKFPSAVTLAAPTTAPAQQASAPTTAPATAPTMVIQAVNTGSDIQSNFFDMWRQDHADVALQDVPGDMVTTSGSGLDPHITLDNAEFQLDRVASKWAADTNKDAANIRKDIEQMLQDNAQAPFGGLAGEKMVNVLQVNLQLREKYGSPS